ncbi:MULTISPECIES: GNAT family N-acetyltransferase [Methylobacterium]|uniref:N-acetyltransferase domain-containing protein n=1 Tax=Methylobacterium jeotgali TaxID=381630 RepID=A0ABQ4T2W0_9HYPH|nr:MULTISPECIES: GNAT family N-acetyltransferase [Methylobacterium]GBU19841.1 hypothetical protein AwMethylo_40560 [Methylobacterium sp.]GJE08528.1 hypothetical protein AOPFMNJM_3868 [Methylobacterium jeotgali]
MASLAHRTAAPLVRRLWQSDRATVLAFFERLDGPARASRFTGRVGPAGVRAYAERVLSPDGLAFGAFVDDELRGLAELMPLRASRGASPHACFAPVPLGAEAEIAYAVERPFRRIGLGRALHARIEEAARSRGVSELRVRRLRLNEMPARPVPALALLPGRSDARRPVAERPFERWHAALASAFEPAR